MKTKVAALIARTMVRRTKRYFMAGCMLYEEERKRLSGLSRLQVVS
jgi:hypothetical protein